ncbi:glycosyltransferase family 48 protein [Babjeviella inositovora NRRL Y-12698]|uniref:1,3-beta-glucan synthase n=1 Tax=Babjeviella inositovora NRRL Y-12698 TaxID=984486 RepID=A0A1E3QKS6_9ASCO|nr:glycosyltransferase family 48 protein [Babjeviella inositovora NRRL Y-12698]ODQ77692.1 glycosyltransferase family 48 protein [Babjeviella inositovora NRRL Y-12698]
MNLPPLDDDYQEPRALSQSPYQQHNMYNVYRSQYDPYKYDEYAEVSYPEDPVYVKKPSDSKYPGCSEANGMPLLEEDIHKVFADLGHVLGFQSDSVANMLEHFMIQLDSRASRMSALQALDSLHCDYIGGEHSNYRKWYFAAQLDLDEEVGFANIKFNHQYGNKKFKGKKKGEKSRSYSLTYPQTGEVLRSAEFKWKQKMLGYSVVERVRHVALYLLLWGEANNVRFLPETLCFIFKCALDYLESTAEAKALPQNDYLDRVITPLYMYIRQQQYDLTDGNWVKSEKDHSAVIGYDDINQLFWYPEGLDGIVFTDGTRLVDLPLGERYLSLGDISWKDSCRKTYYETRTWLHVVTNFNRIWIIHVCVFWYYTSYNSKPLYTRNYSQLLDNKPQPHAVCSVMAFAGTLACFVQILATLSEWAFVPRKWPGAQRLTKRMLLLLLVTAVNFGPSVYILGLVALDEYSLAARVIAGAQLAISFVTVAWFSYQPLGSLFTGLRVRNSRRFTTSRTFTASFPQLNPRGHFFSVALWVCVFAAKFSESYFFLTLSLKDPIRNLATMSMTRCVGEVYFGSRLCLHQAKLVLLLMYVADLILFFLDTYLWYIICNCIFSVALAFSLGMSVLSPWRNIFTRLPKRIFSKILCSAMTENTYKPKLLVSQIWNGIVISMYREHLLSSDHVRNLIYDRSEEGCELRTPLFFVYQDDSALTLNDFFPPNLEAERRVTFFAQSLATPIPEPVPTDCMPTFTVLIPHYSEKILLKLKEVIREDKDSKLSLLEYLKQLSPIEWECFVKDTKLISRQEASSEASDEQPTVHQLLKGNIDDLPFYCVGFKSSSPLYTLRTRIWASLRTQTLYRTVSGFMNYHRAIKLLHRVENPDILEYYGTTPAEIEYELDVLARRKFYLIVSMQRYQQLSKDELEDANYLIRAYPELKIAYLDEVTEADGVSYYSTLLEAQRDGEAIEVVQKYRIKLSGNPILGDGKSDNQNHALIFYRGEYIQVIDANQDNYLEECLKIRSVLSEFEENEIDPSPPYIPGVPYQDISPVAILGAREYIFSESIGVLGDIAAGKEQTFGTLFARTLAEIGGKLHYGHPDFLNAIFMTTRGGISKAQRGLHLNEDIYAGMNAVARGGRIKHCDYFQCGKGRDLGFGSILNFTSKIGAGMGEQMLSREYYYMGTQLPLHRFLSFYYAHPGFHVNNLLIILSVQLFMFVLLNLGALARESIMCIYDKDVPITDLHRPIGCYNLRPVLDWVDRFVLSVFICFFISFAPLVVQELSEQGIWKSVIRLSFHLISMAPAFEVFVCQIYSNSLKTNISFGGAKYIPTGRGFATSRTSFSLLYASYAQRSIYLGARVFLVLLFASVAMWQVSLLWFWLTVVSLCLSPFFFNPHQFSWTPFFLDYRDYIRWLTRGNTKSHHNSWIGFMKSYRAKYTGYKRRKLQGGTDSPASTFLRVVRGNLIFSEVLLPFCGTFFTFVAYTFINAQNGVKEYDSVNSILRMLIVVFAPIVLNVCTLLGIGTFVCILGPAFNICSKRLGVYTAGLAHTLAIVYHALSFQVLWLMEGYDFTRTLAGFICVVYFQRLIFKLILVLFVTRELQEYLPNTSFWSGVWFNRGMGFLVLSQPVREFFVKVVEMSFFAMDFFLGHFLLFLMVPFLLVPLIDVWHSSLLFWLKPHATNLSAPILSKRQRRVRKKRMVKYFLLYCCILLLFAALLLGPFYGSKYIPEFRSTLPTMAKELFQPVHQNRNDTGSRAPHTIVVVAPTVRQA